MSITKKKSLGATKDSPREEKYLHHYVVSDDDMQDFIRSLGIRDVDAAAARFQVVADLTADADSLDQAKIRRIRRLINESENSHYLRIMSAMIAAIKEGPKRIQSAHLTASHIVEMSFRWTIEYCVVLDMYRDKLRKIKQAAESKNRLSRRTKRIAR